MEYLTKVFSRPAAEITDVIMPVARFSYKNKSATYPEGEVLEETNPDVVQDRLARIIGDISNHSYGEKVRMRLSSALIL